MESKEELKNSERILMSAFCGLKIWAQEKDKLYIDLIFNLDFTMVEFPVDFSKINHNTLTQGNFNIRFPKLCKCWKLSVLTSLKLENKAGSLFCHLRSCSVIWEAQNQYCVQLNLLMEHNYHTSVNVGPEYWFVMLSLLRKFQGLLIAVKNSCSMTHSKDCTTLAHRGMYLPYMVSLFL